MAKDDPPTVKRYKATYSGYYRGTYYETSVVTYGKTREETITTLTEVADSGDHPSKLYEGVYKGGTGRKAQLNITPFQRVELRFVETGRRIIPQSDYLRYKGTPKEQKVKGSMRTYITGYYEIPEDEIEHRMDEDLAEWEKS